MMKLLLFSDLHTDKLAARELLAKSADVDLLVGAGDFGNMGRQVRDCVDILCASPVPAVLVPGNNETTLGLIEACVDWQKATVLHGQFQSVLGITFFGIGGGIPITPFGAWSFDFSEDQAAELLADCPQGCVLVTHSPPKGVVDASSGGRSLGSTAIRAAIERVKPRLVVCGHIHGSAGQVGYIGETPVVNAGPSGVVWKLDAAGTP